MTFGIFLLVAALIAGVESVPTISAINNLSSMLMKGYNKNTLPIADFDGKFELNVEVFLVALGDIDEIEERLSTVLMFIYTWNDVSMRWNSSDHSDIQNLTMTWSQVWKPILLVINPHQEATQSHSERAS
ncbi:neuronal acetylcholine receptor subunit eat-2-like, partial [Ruditapes philippinarum]|uniref:neuronal acetylcholine receptor subunit eat-2-like n=1 Tax=Ruditapes philippinarum TaxID=129788 RepID=UPI00295C0BCF